MAMYRVVQMSFWSDRKVCEDFTPEDKYFYLYLFTNPHTNLAGCYELGIKQAANETGYNTDTIERLMDRFKDVHKVIDYSKETKEILILKWGKYNWTNSPDYKKGLLKQIEGVKSNEFKEYLMSLLDDKETVYTPSIDGGGTSNTITITNTITINEIIDYLNLKAEKHFKPVKASSEYINARLKEGFTIEDFKKVIDKKCNSWKNTKMDQYLRPQTLFTPNNFQAYLNEKEVSHGTVEHGEKYEMDV